MMDAAQLALFRSLLTPADPHYQGTLSEHDQRALVDDDAELRERLELQCRISLSLLRRIRAINSKPQP